MGMAVTWLSGGLLALSLPWIWIVRLGKKGFPWMTMIGKIALPYVVLSWTSVQKDLTADPERSDDPGGLERKGTAGSLRTDSLTDLNAPQESDRDNLETTCVLRLYKAPGVLCRQQEDLTFDVECKSIASLALLGGTTIVFLSTVVWFCEGLLARYAAGIGWNVPVAIDRQYVAYLQLLLQLLIWTAIVCSVKSFLINFRHRKVFYSTFGALMAVLLFWLAVCIVTNSFMLRAIIGFDLDVGLEDLKENLTFRFSRKIAAIATEAVRQFVALSIASYSFFTLTSLDHQATKVPRQEDFAIRKDENTESASRQADSVGAAEDEKQNSTASMHGAGKGREGGGENSDAPLCSSSSASSASLRTAQTDVTELTKEKEGDIGGGGSEATRGGTAKRRKGEKNKKTTEDDSPTQAATSSTAERHAPEIPKAAPTKMLSAQEAIRIYLFDRLRAATPSQVEVGMMKTIGAFAPFLWTANTTRFLLRNLGSLCRVEVFRCAVVGMLVFLKMRQMIFLLQAYSIRRTETAIFSLKEMSAADKARTDCDDSEASKSNSGTGCPSRDAHCANADRLSKFATERTEATRRKLEKQREINVSVCWGFSVRAVELLSSRAILCLLLLSYWTSTAWEACQPARSCAVVPVSGAMIHTQFDGAPSIIPLAEQQQDLRGNMEDAERRCIPSRVEKLDRLLRVKEHANSHLSSSSSSTLSPPVSVQLAAVVAPHSLLRALSQVALVSHLLADAIGTVLLNSLYRFFRSPRAIV